MVDNRVLEDIKDKILNDSIINYDKLVDVCAKYNVDYEKIVKKICGDKKLLAVFGNCQVLSYVPLLYTSSKIREQYIILSLPSIQLMSEDTKKYGLNKDIMQMVDLLIYQNVSKENKFSPRLSSAAILGLTRSEMTKICIPNAYFTGYFPQCCTQHYGGKVRTPDGKERVVFPYGDRNIEDMYLKKHMNVAEIEEKIKQKDFYEKEYIVKNAEDSLDELRNRELQCDVRISDYIENNFRDTQLFFTMNHPRNMLLKEILVRSFSLLGIDVSDINTHKVFENKGCKLLIYPSVERALGLLFHRDKFSYYIGKTIDVSMGEFIEAYIDYCFRKNGK